MEIKKLRVDGLNRLMKWPLLCGLLSLMLVHTAPATIPLYDNESVLNYTIPPDIFTTIDASNFLNNSSLTINYANLTINTLLFEPMNTVNYTNSKTGILSANNRFPVRHPDDEWVLPSDGGHFLQQGHN